MTSTTILKPETKKVKPVVAGVSIVSWLLVGDVIGLLLCWRLSDYLFKISSSSLFNPLFYACSLLVVIGFYLVDAYKPDKQVSGMRTPWRIIVSNTLVAIIIASAIYLFAAWNLGITASRSAWLPGHILFTVWAISLRFWSVSWLRATIKRDRWLLLGRDGSALQFAQAFATQEPSARFVVIGNSARSTLDIDSVEHIVSFEDLPGLGSTQCSGVLLSNDFQPSNEQIQHLMNLRLQGIPIYRLPDFYETAWSKIPADLLHDHWFVFSSGFNLIPDGINAKFKRFFDWIAAAIALLILAPVFLLVAVAIRVDTPGPIFYSQIRSGLNGKPFRVYKFRSMRQDAEKMGAQWAQKRDPRITRVGYLLRLSRLDELPQLWNVVSGNMSLIGPRPERPEFDEKLAQKIPYYSVRYLVKPGITGWAQVMYPYGASVEDAYEKLSYDLYYIKNYSLWLDIAIAFKTVRVMLLGKGR
jgi:exopolysaccharide biosynthesis polyprenyl glycosylphosphotransferase